MCICLCEICLLYQSLIIVVDSDEGSFLTLLLLCMYLKPSEVPLQQFFAHQHRCDRDDTDD